MSSSSRGGAHPIQGAYPDFTLQGADPGFEQERPRLIQDRQSRTVVMRLRCGRAVHPRWRTGIDRKPGSKIQAQIPDSIKGGPYPTEKSGSKTRVKESCQGPKSGSASSTPGWEKVPSQDFGQGGQNPKCRLNLAWAGMN